MRLTPKSYSLAWLRHDVAAGLGVAAVALPIAIAYPAIADLPVQSGIHATVVAMVAYALCGPSRHVILGPDAATMTVLAAVLASAAASNPGMTSAQRIDLVILLAIGAGLLCFLGYVLRLGVLASLLSRPILIGFFAGISINLLIGQIGRVTGVKIDSKGLVPPIMELLDKRDAINVPSVVIAALVLAILETARWRRFAVPGPVIGILLGLGCAWLYDPRAHGVSTIGVLPTDLPHLSLPSVSGLQIDDIVLGSMALFIVTFGSGIITVRTFATQTGAKLRADAELIGFGAANVASGLSGGFAVTAADSRTAVNVAAGARTRLAGAVAAIVLVAAVQILGDSLQGVPIPVLGAILVSAALHLIDLASLRELWRISRIEFVFCMVAVVGAVGLGVLKGVVVAIGSTLIYIVMKGMQTRVVVLGRIPGRDGIYKLHRWSEARPVPGMAITLIQGSLLFYNADQIGDQLTAIAETLPADTDWLVIDASAMPMVDSTGAEVLRDVSQRLGKRNIRMGIADLYHDPKGLLERAGLFSGPSCIHVLDNTEEFISDWSTRSLSNIRS